MENKEEANSIVKEVDINLNEMRASLEAEYQKKFKWLNDKIKELLDGKNKEIQSATKEYSDVLQKTTNARTALTKCENDLVLAKTNFNSVLEEYKNDRILKLENALNENLNKAFSQLQRNYESNIGNLADSVKWAQDLLDNTFSDLTKEYEKSLKAKKALIDKETQDLLIAKNKYEQEIEKYADVEEKRASLEILDRKLAVKEKMLDKLIEKEVQKRYAEINSEVKGYEAEIKKYLAELNELREENRNLLNDLTNAETLDKISIDKKNRELEKRLLELNKRFDNLTDDQYEELKNKALKYDDTVEKNRQLRIAKTELELQVERIKSDTSNLATLQFQKDALEEQIRANRLILSNLSSDINDLTTRLDGNKNTSIASEAIETKLPEFENKSSEENSNIDEIEWLDRIMSDCKESGYIFSKRLFYSFHTCLKSSDMSPLTVLAGVSGTGKSKLPQLYSRFGGLYFISVPVQPDWDSPQSLFGYFNSIEKRFNATSLLRALVSFQANHSKSNTKEQILDLSNRVLIVLLDEMNLAHVELYFSELLSKLEERRGENKEISFEVDLGADNEKYKIYLTDNVKWIGTMNEDETTKSLSDKVVDRGNIISFPRPENFLRYNPKKLNDERPMISRNQWEKWIDNRAVLKDEEISKYMEIIKQINTYMISVNRALGHRVWQSIEDYMSCHPLVINATDEEKQKALDYAFEEALVQKVMTKLRGIDTDGEQREKCLDPIKKLLIDNNLTTIQGDFENAMNSISGTFEWSTAKYLNEEYNLKNTEVEE